MPDVKDLTIGELEYLIEQKILEVLWDPDSGLELEPEFKQELKSRLGNPSGGIPHREAVSRIGRIRHGDNRETRGTVLTNV